jgi:basic membrane lipoprotein Med (substrate-binding protein (PBP1-ABC) superfamily)
MMDAGVDVIMTACGGANQGVIAAAQERGKYVLYFDDDNYKLAPKVIVGCAAIYQEKAVYEKVKEAVQGNLKYGEAVIFDTKGGYLDFVDKNPLYAEAVSEPVRTEMAKMLQDVRSGKLKLDVPKYW